MPVMRRSLRSSRKTGWLLFCAARSPCMSGMATIRSMSTRCSRTAGELCRSRLSSSTANCRCRGCLTKQIKSRFPRFAQRIGVVTSETGAALQDILNILSRRCPMAQVVFAPALVQGREAPDSLIAALQALDEWGKCDVIIIGRGGGSMEDLWCFNDERLVRQIVACHTPIISAVGHETDFTLCDYAADLRAPTPSAAAGACQRQDGAAGGASGNTCGPHKACCWTLPCTKGAAAAASVLAAYPPYAGKAAARICRKIAKSLEYDTIFRKKCYNKKTGGTATAVRALAGSGSDGAFGWRIQHGAEGWPRAVLGAAGAKGRQLAGSPARRCAARRDRGSNSLKGV